MGCWVDLLLDSAIPQQVVAIAVGITVILLMRLAAPYGDIRLPEFSPGDEEDRRGS